MRACFGSSSFCDSVFTQNSAPTADAGDDQEVAGGDPVTLDGSRSADPDGRIDSFSWVQTSGESVTLRDADGPLATFDAPVLSEETRLAFQLTVVDDRQAADRDSVTVSVVPQSTIAVQAGIDWLSDSMPPWPLAVVKPCDGAVLPVGQAWFAHAGAWLTVMSRSMDDGYSGDRVTAYLDAARTLLAQAPQSEVSGTAAGELAASLWQQGLESLHRFTLDRDPALAEWAAGIRLPDLDVGSLAGVHEGTKTLRLSRSAGPEMLDHAASHDDDFEFLRGLTCGSDPLAVAAALMRLQTSRSRPEKMFPES